MKVAIYCRVSTEEQDADKQEGMKFKEISEILEMGKDDVRHYYNVKEEEKNKNQDKNMVKECEKEALKEDLIFNSEIDSKEEIEE